MDRKGKGKAPTSSSREPKSITRSDDWDWRNIRVLNPARNQGRSSSCWAIVACSSVETRYNIRDLKSMGELMQLSVQELIDCNQPDVVIDKEKGYESSINKGLRYIKNNGVRHEKDYKFTVKVGDCRPRTEFTELVTIKDIGKLDDSLPTGNHEKELLRLVRKHPVGACLKVDKSLRTLAKEKIYMGPKHCESHGHAILIVGYGDDDETGLSYWTFLNSWGESWGDKGFGRVVRASCLPAGTAPFLNRVSYPVI